jgi:hypothetical protein
VPRSRTGPNRSERPSGPTSHSRQRPCASSRGPAVFDSRRLHFSAVISAASPWYTVPRVAAVCVRLVAFPRRRYGRQMVRGRAYTPAADPPRPHPRLRLNGPGLAASVTFSQSARSVRVDSRPSPTSPSGSACTGRPCTGSSRRSGFPPSGSRPGRFGFSRDVCVAEEVSTIAGVALGWDETPQARPACHSGVRTAVPTRSHARADEPAEARSR